MSFIWRCCLVYNFVRNK